MIPTRTREPFRPEDVFFEVLVSLRLSNQDLTSPPDVGGDWATARDGDDRRILSPLYLYVAPSISFEKRMAPWFYSC